MPDFQHVLQCCFYVSAAELALKLMFKMSSLITNKKIINKHIVRFISKFFNVSQKDQFHDLFAARFAVLFLCFGSRIGIEIDVNSKIYYMLILYGIRDNEGWKVDNCLKRTKVLVPKVSALERFLCIFSQASFLLFHID